MDTNYESIDQSKDKVFMLATAYNHFLQTNSFLTNIDIKLLEYNKDLGMIFENITKERNWLKFDFLKRKFKIELLICFMEGEYYKTIIFSEILKKEGEERELERIHLDKKNCILNSDFCFDTPASQEKIFFSWLNNYIENEFKVHF